METPINLVMPMVRIRLKCPSLDSFVDKYRADVNMTGIFVRTRSPLAAGTPVSFDFRLADDSCLFRGSGIVVWARADETLAPLLDPGMMLSFDELRDGTREHFDHVLARKRAIDEAADTVPTLVRSYTGDPRPLPMTTKLAAEELEELRSRMRAQMEAEGELPAAPAELAREAAPVRRAVDELPPLIAPEPPEPATEPSRRRLPMMVPAEPRQPVEATPAAATVTPLARVLVLRPQAAPVTSLSPVESAPTAEPAPAVEAAPLPPLPRDVTVVAAKPPARVEVTALVECPPPAPRHSKRLLGVGIASGTLALGVFTLVHLNLAQRILAWIVGA